MDTLTLTQSVARLAAASFTGACLYIVFVEQPARLDARTLAALEQFRASIRRAERMQPILLVSALVAQLSVLSATHDYGRSLGGTLLLAAIVPLSFALLVPINRRLCAGSVEDHRAEGPRLIRRWGHLHALRSLLALLGTVLLW